MSSSGLQESGDAGVKIMSQEELNPSSPTHSTQDFITRYDLGIPHFQRGLVWSEENTALLLESLYLGTPCGTIVLWEPLEPDKQGIPLLEPEREGIRPSDDRKLKYMIVDGQQRIRSLRKVLGAFTDSPVCEPESWASDSDDEGEEASDSNEPHVWCLNLSRVPELAKFFDSSALRWPMFRLIADPTRTKEEARRRYNLIPLRFFFGPRDTNVPGFNGLIRPAKLSATPEDVSRTMDEIQLGPRVRELLKKRLFFLQLVTESSDSYDLAKVVALYNRINSAGKQVEPEEKAFATLVSLYPSTSQWLRDLFKDVHSRAATGDMKADDRPDVENTDNGRHSSPDQSLGRDEVLKRRKERNFGFKLFIRTFIQVCSYHFGISLGANSFSFDVVKSSPFQTALKEREKVEQLFKLTREVVLTVRKTLEELYCDDLQTLPDTTSLLPLFQFLIRFPLLKDARFAKVLQCLALRLLLSKNLSQETVLSYVNWVNSAKTANDCLARLDREIPGPGDLRDSNTLRDRHVLILYWLLRRRGARDFSYRNENDNDHRRLCDREGSPLYGKQGQEELLEGKVQPEKQHIVPYSLLADLYNIEKRGRVSQGKVNNIGNLTYISHNLNSYEAGLGSFPIDRTKGRDENVDDEEKQANQRNLHFHFLAAEAGGAYDCALKQVREATGAAIPQETRKAAQTSFERFCELRRNLIAEAFAAWINELGPQLAIETRVKPEPTANPSLQDQIRSLDYPDDVEDAVLDLVRDKRLLFTPTRRKAEKGLARWMKPASDRRGPGFVMRFLDDQLEVEPVEGSALYRALEELIHGRASRKGRNWVLAARGQDAASTSGILTEFAKALTPQD